MSKKDFTQIWSEKDYRQAVSDFRAHVVQLRAVGEPDLGVIAPVIDITTRKRIA